MVFGITGTNGSGKGTVVDYLTQEKDYAHFSNSGFIFDELMRRGIELSRSNLRLVGNEFRRKHGGGYLVEVALKKAETLKQKDIVIEAIRSVGEAEKIKEADGILLAVDADRQLRYDRIFARKTGKDLVSFDEFVQQEDRELQGTEGSYDMNIKAVMKMADYTIINNGTLGGLHAQIEDVLAQINS